MKTVNIESFDRLKAEIKDQGISYLLIYRKGSNLSDCALDSIKSLPETERVKQIFIADVNSVSDIHPQYGIESVPSLLELDNEKFVRVFKGCNERDFYQSIFSDGFSTYGSSADKPRKHVTVYSTPTCSWCNTLKNYLKDNLIEFRDVDVSTDSKAAEAMVKKSGQQGVPQTEINGTIIVGFDRKRIDSLLEIGQ